MKRAVALLSLALFAAPDRGSITSVERAVDRRMETLFDEPYLLLGTTRGVYLDGVGAIFTTEISLALGPNSPMVSPSTNKDLYERLRRKRLERLPLLRTSMQDSLIRAAEMLPTLPAKERVVLGVTIFRKRLEDNTGVPTQIVMQAAKQELLDKNKAAIQVQEF
jgi:hypothetical protein